MIWQIFHENGKIWTFFCLFDRGWVVRYCRASPPQSKSKSWVFLERTSFSKFPGGLSFIVLGLKWYESSIIFNALHAHWSTLYLDRDGMKLGKKWCIFVQIGIIEDQNIRFFPIWKMLLCFNLVVWKIFFVVSFLL